LDVALLTYPVDDDAVSGGATVVTASVRIVVSPQLRADSYELDVRHLGDWIMHDAIRFVDESEADAAASG